MRWDDLDEGSLCSRSLLKILLKILTYHNIQDKHLTPLGTTIENRLKKS